MDEKKLLPDKIIPLLGDGFKRKFPEDTKPVRLNVPADVRAALEAAEKVDSDLGKG